MPIPWKVRSHVRDLVRSEIGKGKIPSGSDLSMVLIYPGPYGVGMASLGFQTILWEVTKRGDLICDRAFLLEDIYMEELRRRSSSLPSMELLRPIDCFDIIAFSISYELSYPEIVKILDAGGIPIMASEREGLFPLLIGGGPCCFMNPEPIADIFDIFVVGEGEELIHEVLDLIKKRAIDRKGSKTDLLLEIAELEGIYVPSLYKPCFDGGKFLGHTPYPGLPEKIRRRVVRDFHKRPIPEFVVTPFSEFGPSYLIEVVRGCGRGCRFCIADFLYRSPRYRDTGLIMEAMGRAKGICESIGLLGAAVSDHPDVVEIARKGVEMGFRIQTSSLRIEGTSPELVEVLGKGGERTITFAPESGSPRLRERINKALDEERLMDLAEVARRSGIEVMKLYFMIGIPGEEDGDMEGIAGLVRRVSERFGRKVVVSVGALVPKPFTPFQWVPMESQETLRKRLGILKKKVNGKVRLVVEDPRRSILECMLSRGDRRLGKAIISVGLGKKSWRRALADLGINPEEIACKSLSSNEPLPWGVLDSGVPEELLRREFRRSLYPDANLCATL